MSRFTSCVSTMMDEEEQEELRCTGSDVEIEEYTDTEDSPYVAYQSTDKLFDTDQPSWQTFAFLATLFLLIASVSVVLISFPLYLDSISLVSNAYTGFIFLAAASTLILGVLYFVTDRVSPPAASASIGSVTKIEISRWSLFKLSLLYAFSGILVILSLDQNRVLCHLQDPIKGVVLVFSLVYYFFFCRKMMSLQRIFSSTTIIVGLFISVDYGLCDEFRCRGRDVTSHNGASSLKNSWGGKAIWTFVYVGGLAAFAMFFTMLEHHYTTGQQKLSQLLTTQNQNSFLYTVSRLVSSRDIRIRRSSEEEGGRLLHVTDPDPMARSKTLPKPPIMKTLFQIHLITLFLVLTFTWIDTLQGVGRGFSPAELYESIVEGLICHFKSGSGCRNVSSHAWIFLLAYVGFSISMLNFLSMSESAVFSVAAATVSLPLSGIWWSLYKMDISSHGATISWSPGVTGELICALLGLPVVLLGLGLLVRSHFRDNRLPFQSGIQPPEPFPR